MRLASLLLSTLLLGLPSCASTQSTVMPDSVSKSDTLCKMGIKSKKVQNEKPLPPPIKVSSLLYQDYSEPIEKVKKRFRKEQVTYPPSAGGQYYFKVFPVLLYPFFCLSKKDTIDPEIYRLIYSEGSETCIGAYADRFSMDHVLVAVLQYIKNGSAIPRVRTYMLFSLRKNYATKEWEPEKPPMIITMYYNAKTDSYFSK